MKLDKDTNYDNFVAWVSEQAPDILAIEETNGFTKETLTALANRWGHSHAEICKETGYPVSLTSKYPIEVISRIRKGVSHGGIHAQIKGINILVLHLYPQSYAPSGSTAANGDAYRLEEIQTSTRHHHLTRTIVLRAAISIIRCTRLSSTAAIEIRYVK